MAASRVQFTWLGTTKSLSPDQKQLAANAFDANRDSISAGKKLIDTRHDAYRELTRLKHEITRYWRDISLPYPDAGIRLMRHNDIEVFHERLLGFQMELSAAARNLDRHFEELKDAARIRLGSLFSESDYPATLEDAFAVTWDFPTIDPPDYLRQLSPELYREQSQLVSQRFERAVEMAEQAFIEELNRLVQHLTERLGDESDGQRKIFRDSAVENLQAFFERFRLLNVRSNEELDDLVSSCERIVRGVRPDQLRQSASMRHQIGTQLTTVQSSLDELLVDRPRRRILRDGARWGQAEHEGSSPDETGL
jgi:hypothetical protein